MKDMKGITISEMAKELGIDKNTVAQRLFVAKIKPMTREALYALSTLETIRSVPGKGRPKKPPEAKIEPATPEESRKAEKRIREYHRDPSSFVPFKKSVTK